METITIKEYLTRKGIEFQERYDELITKCLFSDCDADSRGKEAHLYFSAQTSQYQCKKCDTGGNIFTLIKHFGDEVKDIMLNPPQTLRKPRKKRFDPSVVESCHQALPNRIRQYLNSRGIADALIDQYKLGYGEFYGRKWITIPVTDKEGVFSFLKLRQDPEDTANENRYMFYPAGSEAALYGLEMLHKNDDCIFICEGELDKLALEANSIAAITSTAGVNTFKQEWYEELKALKKIYLCFDSDEAGRGASAKLAKQLEAVLPRAAIFGIEFPPEMKGKDVTDYFIQNGGTTDGLFALAKQIGGCTPVDISKFQPMTSNDLIKILGLTIKKDEENKLVAFLCLLTAFTENAQFNVSFNAPSSTGKSYIPTEVSRLFPKEDVMEIGYCSPTAFFHDYGAYNKEKKGFEMDLSRKIMIFLDQPHMQLLERLRPLLSHDEKEICHKITDKTQKNGLRAKNVYIRGFPAVVFCSAGLNIDEQEGTRFMLLSPETSQEKLRESILEKIKKETDLESYMKELNDSPERALLKERIRAIRDEGIDDIVIQDPSVIQSDFLEKREVLKPRHQRDIGRLINLVKAFTLLNLWFRERDDKKIIASKEDIVEAIKVWDRISESQEHNLPPYIYNIYLEVILPIYQEKNPMEEMTTKVGVLRQEVITKYSKVYGRPISLNVLRNDILPMLETSGLIIQEKDQIDRRNKIIYPTMLRTISQKKEGEEI